MVAGRILIKSIFYEVIIYLKYEVVDRYVKKNISICKVFNITSTAELAITKHSQFYKFDTFKNLTGIYTQSHFCIVRYDCIRYLGTDSCYRLKVCLSSL